MAPVEQFANGPVSPVAALVMAFVGAFVGLSCTARARRVVRTGDRVRWLLFGAVAMGGAGVWLMHFIAMLGFDVPSSPIRFGIWTTVASLGMAIAVTAVGLLIAGTGRRSVVKIILGGVFTGGGLAAMHYTGMSAMQMDGHISYDRNKVIASVVVGVIASIVAMWFSVTVRGRVAIVGASAVFAVAAAAMHYTAMSAVQVTVFDTDQPLGGVAPVLLIVPIITLATAALFGLLFTALNMIGDEEFAMAVPRAVLDHPADPAPTAMPPLRDGSALPRRRADPRSSEPRRSSVGAHRAR